MSRRGATTAVALGLIALAACASSDVGNGIDAAGDDDGAAADATPESDAPTDAVDALETDACVPLAETCNDADDDCDGMTDEGFGLGAMCDGADADLCAEGAVVCGVGGGTMCGDTTGDNVETCNGLNDDCDAVTDEGFNVGMPCDGGDTDACVEGTIACAGDGTATCNDTTSSTVEICNGLDDDCQAGIDNGYAVNTTCSAGVGACLRTGTYQCNGDGTGVLCNATAAAPSAEICGDGVDQDCSGADVACPTNDRPTGAVNITAGGTFTADLTAANNDQDFSGPSCGSTGGRDVFYTFTLPASEVVYVDTFNSNFDTTVRIFSGTCTAIAAHQACFDDACSVLQTQGAVQLAAGTYCLVLDQYSSNQTLGSATLTFTRGGRTGTPIAGSGTLTGTTVNAANVTTPSACAVGSSQGPDVAYHFLVCPAVTATVSANTCATPTSWDSILYLRRAPATSSDLTCNDDSVTACGTASPVRLSNFTGATAAGPGLFWLTVDGYGTASGAFTLGYAIQ